MPTVSPSYTWEYVHDDHVNVVTFQIRQLGKNPAIRRSSVTSPTLWILGSIATGYMVYAASGLSGAITGGLLFAICFPLLMRFSTQNRVARGALRGEPEKQLVERYISRSNDIVPFGTHTLTLRDGFLDWYWHDREELISMRARRIDSIVEFRDRLFLMEGPAFRASVPIRAFGDEANRRVFESFIANAEGRSNTLELRIEP